MAGEVLLIALTLLIIAILYFKWRFGYWKRRGIEHPPISFPFGNALRIILRKVTFANQFQEVYVKYKQRGLRYAGFYFSTKPWLIIIDLELVKTILTKDFVHFMDHGNYINEENEPLTGNLFALKGQRWRHLRAKLTPTFTSGKMKMMFHTIVDCSKGLTALLDDMAEKQEALDIKDVSARFTTDIIGSCAFGIDCNSLKDPNSEFRTYGKKVFDISLSQTFIRFLAITFPKVVDTFGLQFLGKEVNTFFMNIVKSTVDYRETNNIVRNDFMHLLIQLKNNISIKDDDHPSPGNLKKVSETPSTNDTLTIGQIAAQSLGFFIAGFETSSTTLTFCFYEIVLNEDIQTKLRNEINTILKKYDGNITYDGVMELTYMDMCIQETLRKYPTLPLLLRECTKTYTIPDSDVVVEKGTIVAIPIIGIQRDPEYYPEPDTFDPERFSNENKANRPAFAWLPFGEGPRACIGLRFGLMQIKAALTVLLRNYKFTLNSKTETPLIMSSKSLFMRPKDNVWLNIEKL